MVRSYMTGERDARRSQKRCKEQFLIFNNQNLTIIN